jgi:hypothetical protein
LSKIEAVKRATASRASALHPVTLIYTDGWRAYNDIAQQTAFGPAMFAGHGTVIHDVNFVDPNTMKLQ